MPILLIRVRAGLLKPALKSKLTFKLGKITEAQHKGDNTAGAVTHVTLHRPFVFRFEFIDGTGKKEAHTMRDIQNNSKLPQDFRNV